MNVEIVKKLKLLQEEAGEQLAVAQQLYQRAETNRFRISELQALIAAEAKPVSSRGKQQAAVMEILTHNTGKTYTPFMIAAEVTEAGFEMTAIQANGVLANLYARGVVERPHKANYVFNGPKIADQLDLREAA